MSVATLSDTFTQAAIRGDASLFAAFKSTDASRAFTVLDNFAINDVIPEPASLALLGLGGLMLLPRRRTNRVTRHALNEPPHAEARGFRSPGFFSSAPAFFPS